MERKRVVIYGDSLILAGVQASLGVSPDLEIIILREPPVDLVKMLYELLPAALIFDLCSTRPELPLADLQQLNLLLIGVDPSSSELLVLSSHLQPALGISDLVQAIKTHIVER